MAKRVELRGARGAGQALLPVRALLAVGPAASHRLRARRPARRRPARLQPMPAAARQLSQLLVRAVAYKGRKTAGGGGGGRAAPGCRLRGCCAQGRQARARGRG